MAAYVHSSSAGNVRTQSSPGNTGVPLGQTQSAVQAVESQPTTQVRDEIPRRQRLMILGIIQMVAGSVCFCFEFTGLIVGPAAYVTGVGIWAGVFFFVTGLLSFLSGRLYNRCLVVACLVMCIIASIVAWIGISFTGVEIRTFNDDYYRSTFVVHTTPTTSLVTNGQLVYERIKASINIMVCILEFVVTIVSASFIKGCCCKCCVPAEPRRPVAQQVYVTTTTHVQQPVPMVHSRQHQRTQPILRTPTTHSLETGLQIDLSIGIRPTPIVVPRRYRPNRRQVGLSAGAWRDEALIHFRGTPPPYEQSQQGRF